MVHVNGVVFCCKDDLGKVRVILTNEEATILSERQDESKNWVVCYKKEVPARYYREEG